MSVRIVPWLTVWAAVVVVMVRCCPQNCTCVDKAVQNLANCAYKELENVPTGLPPNITTLSLSANKIKLLKSKSFVNVTQVNSLWLAHNEIVTIERDTLAPMIQLKNLDISYNKIVNFPWEDLQNLTALQLIKMNNNEMVSLPKDAFSTLVDLRSLRINHNNAGGLHNQEEDPLLLIIVVVSIFLLALATVPLLGATCCHLLYKYQGKTYKLIMKAQNPDQMEKQMASDFDPRASFVGSEKNFNPSELEEEGEEGDEPEDADREGEAEGSVVTDSNPGSSSKTNPEEFEVGSEYSDRLPLGAEAVTISEEINGNYKEPSR
uniref:Immunoglobulin superfamily containing leucine-rich repeat 2 n=1 Tax=Neogobius melanostomus TaxID=47308 RepID=A0A8C6SQI6_9GOBI